MRTVALLLSGLVLQTLPAVAATAEELTRIAELREERPAEALALAELLWESEPGDEVVGRALLESLNAAKEHQRAYDLARELSRFPDLTPARRANVLFGKLTATRFLKQMNELDDDAELAIELGRQLEPDPAAKLFAEVALAYNAEAKYLPSGEFYQRAINLRGSAADNVQKMYFSNLGVMYAQQGRFPEAVDALQNGLRIADELGDAAPVDLLRNLGGLMLSQGRFEDSLPYARRALAAVPPDSRIAASLLGNIGVAYQQLERFDEAEEQYTRALAITDALKVDNPSALNNLAFLLHEKGRHRRSLTLLSRSRAISEREKQWDLVAIAKKNQAENWIALGDRRRAARLMEESYEHFVTYDLRPNRLELYPVMIDNLDALDRHARALKLMREYKDLYDESVNVESAERVAELQSQYELEQDQLELAKAQRDRLLNDGVVQDLQYSREIERGVRTALITGLILLSIIAFLLLRALQFRGKANRVLEKKNEQIASQAEDLARLNEQLVEQSRNDELTGLFNRRFLSLHLEKEVPRLQRVAEAGGQIEQLVIMADLDHFKQINDEHGHAAGDQVLKAFAETLKSCARESDFCVRWGGEEFLWFCREATQADGPALCERLLRAAAETAVILDGTVVHPTCSIGFAPLPMWENLSSDGKLDWDLTLEAADAALYEAKRTGRNRWCGVRPSSSVRPDTAPPSAEHLLKRGDLQIYSSDALVMGLGSRAKSPQPPGAA